jgi:hypothetical protein
MIWAGVSGGIRREPREIYRVWHTKARGLPIEGAESHVKLYLYLILHITTVGRSNLYIFIEHLSIGSYESMFGCLHKL